MTRFEGACDNPRKGVASAVMLIQVFLLALIVSPEAAPAQAAAQAGSARAEAYYQFSLGLQERLAGNVDEALAAYRRAQKLDPASSSIRVKTARLLREMGRLDETLQEAKEAVALDADDTDAHQVLAQLEQIQAAGPDARASPARGARCYRQAPRRPTALRAIAECALRGPRRR